MPLLRRSGELHLSLGSGYNNTVLIDTRRHWVWIQHGAHILDICYETEVRNISVVNPTYAPLFALDSATLDEPGSAELQYNVLVYG